MQLLFLILTKFSQLHLLSQYVHERVHFSIAIKEKTKSIYEQYCWHTYTDIMILCAYVLQCKFSVMFLL